MAYNIIIIITIIIIIIIIIILISTNLYRSLSMLPPPLNLLCAVAGL
jgi:hypothetical protein